MRWGVESRPSRIRLTAHVRLADRARALSAGFQMFITKPLVPQELISVLGDLARPRNNT